ncbi:MAG: hypothetical protein AB7V13_26085 [Pseudorhodoplanes sp.]|uniref:hypothetical protein n=1 Tax=Pseudorhodoplanes sp. TaxID=1934341 RepID=UPI003D0BA392
MHRTISPFLVLLALTLLAPIQYAGAQDKPAAAPDDAAASGSWRFERDPRGNPELSFVRDGKVIFYVGVGRAVAVWIAYPGPPQPDGKAQVTLKTTAQTWTLEGELQNEHAFTNKDQPATYFVNWDLGLDRSKKEYRNISRRYNRFIDTLFSSKAIYIASRAGVITLPAISIGLLPDAQRQMKL